MPFVSQVRATALLDLPALALEAGIDPYTPLREAQIDPALFERADLTIPADRVAWLLDGMAERYDLPDLGIRLAMRRRLANIGVAGLVLGQQATVREALAMVERYRHLMSDSLSLHVEEDAGRAVAMLGLIVPGSAPQRQSRELGLAAFIHLFRLILGDDWSPDSVHFTHTAPRKPTQHRRFFGCPVQFGGLFDGFEFDAHVLDKPKPGADAALAAYAKNLLDSMGAQASGATTAIVARLIHTLVPMGHASIAHVARVMGRNVRTLQRDLASEGVEFSALLSEIRGELARAYLKDSSDPVDAIAARLGYSSSTAFIRFFRSKFGVAPGSWRKTIADQDRP
jgi:AraC-like DNA-binding protein